MSQLAAPRTGSDRISAPEGGDPVAVLGRLGDDRGQGVVEFAMVLPILAALILIFIQFGKAINYWIDLTHVANEAARIATVGAPGVGNFKSTVCGYLETGELKNGSNEVNPAQVQIAYPVNPDPATNGSTRDIGDPVQVRVSSTYHWLPFWNAGTWTIVGSATMRLERDVRTNTVLNPATGTCP